MLNFAEYSTWVNALVFAGAAAAVWYAGTKLERMADEIARRTGLGQAFIGVVLLAAATSLPEIATTISALAIGNTSLAVHNLLGSVVFNTAVLVIADLAIGPKALTHRAPSFVLLIQGVGVVFLLTIVLMGGAVGRGLDAPIMGPKWLLEVGLWEVILLASYLGVLFVTYHSQRNPRWEPIVRNQPDKDSAGGSSEKEKNEPHAEWSSGTLYAAFAGASLVVLAGGWALAQTGDALAQQTGLGSSFVGFALLAIATTLPEISTTVAAARAGNDEMAFSNVFGSSAFVIMLLALIGLAVGAEAVIQAAAPSAAFAAALGILLICVYLWGLLERRDRTVARVGWDSAAVLVLTLAGSGVMYMIK